MNLISRAAAVVLVMISGASGAVDFPGISITPPSGEEWIRVQDSAHAVAWMRRTEPGNLTMGVALLTQALNRRFDNRGDFLAWVTHSKEANPDPQRFRLVSNRVSETTRQGYETCADYTTVIEDLSGGPAAVLRLEVSGLACLHPVQPLRYYDIQYSARMPTADELPEALAREGRQFVDSARFTAPPADGDWALGQAARSPGRRETT